MTYRQPPSGPRFSASSGEFPSIPGSAKLIPGYRRKNSRFAADNFSDAIDIARYLAARPGKFAVISRFYGN
jgi:hypothetical protein